MCNSISDKNVYNRIEDCALTVFLCAAVAHQTGTGFDAIFVRVTFLVYAAVVFGRILLKDFKLIINGYVIWQLIFYGYIVISCLWGDPDFSTYYFTQFIQILFLTISLSQRIKSVADVEKCLRIYYLALIYMVILLYIKSPASDWGTDNIGSAIGLWRNSLGIYTATGFLLGIFFVRVSKSRLLKILNILVMIIFAYVALSSGSRKAVFMVVSYMALYYIFYKKRELKEAKTLLRTILGIIVLIILIYLGFRQIMNSDLLVAKRLESMINIFFEGGIGSEGSIQERNFYIKMAKQLFYKYPIFGTGSNGFAAYMKEIGYSHVAYCHNNFWELLSTLGIIGFTIYYSMQIFSVCKSYPWRENMQTVRELATTLWAALLVTIIFGWWFVYYVSVSVNYLFILIYMLIYIKTRENR